MLQRGDLDDAQQAIERALAIYEHNYGSEHSQVAKAIGGLGTVLEARGDRRGALAQYHRALAIQERVLGPQHFALTDSLFLIADIHAQLDENQAAREAFERSLALELAADGGGARTAETRGMLAAVCWALGDKDAARAYAAKEDLAGIDEAPPDLVAAIDDWLATH